MTLCLEMDYLTCAFIFVSFVSNSLAQQPQQVNPLGVRYSAATDVSHVSFSSPLVTYGSALSDIQLPAAPIQPTIKTSQPEEPKSANPQLKSPQGFSSSQPQTVARYSQPQQQSQYPVAQPQFSQEAQPQYSQAQYPVVQPQYSQAVQPQYPVAQPQYSQVAQPQYSQLTQPQYSQAVPPQYSQAAQPQYSQAAQPQYPVSQPQYSQGGQPQYPVAQAQYSQAQYTQPSAPLVSRVAFNGPLSGFSYQF
ncbi:unnamed protein product [Ceutorhynchus assimilis]|uniref:Uncharacterized protein n=1 Tax=Ceutorhynchus assimilis TaxID=467358 RepID=A0A9N9N0U2_9CUCU|nr:unnamed protein product [Ceutorhynchus assimilis]